MIHILHGFLGSPEDFHFLHELGEVRLHDLYTTNQTEIASQVGPQDILVGYSMGGRLALEIAHAKAFQVERLILINAHPGLSTEEEKKHRRVWEEDVLLKLKSSPEAFLGWWNALPIFKSDEPLAPLSEEKLLGSIRLFESMRLSEQRHFLPELRIHREKILWVIGEQDDKYLRLAQEYLGPLGIRYRLCSGGHRLFQNKNQLVTLLKEELG